MEDPLGVDERDRLGHARGQLEEAIDAQRPAVDERREVARPRVLEDQRRHAIVRVEASGPDDPGYRKAAEDLRLVLEELAVMGPRAQRRLEDDARSIARRFRSDDGEPPSGADWPLVAEVAHHRAHIVQIPCFRYAAGLLATRSPWAYGAQTGVGSA